MENQYRFSYIVVNDLDDLEAKHPAVSEKSIRSFLRNLQSCPDIYDDFPCFFYLTDRTNQIVCSSKAFPDTLYIGGERSRPWAWMGNLFTHESHRGKGLARLLVEESTVVAHHRGIARGGVFSTDITLKINKKLGHSVVGHAPRYLFPASLQPFLSPVLKSEGLARGVDTALKPFLRTFLRSRLKKISSIVDNSGYIIELHESDMESLKSIFTPISYGNRCHFNDRLEKLLWKRSCSNRNEGNTCSLYLIRDSKNNAPNGYFVIRTKRQREPLGVKYKDFNLMTLMDFGFFQPEAENYPRLVKHVLHLFLTNNADVLEVITNSGQLGLTLRQMGMFRVGRGMSFSYSLPQEWGLGKRYDSLDQWHLTHFCGDGFTF